MEDISQHDSGDPQPQPALPRVAAGAPVPGLGNQGGESPSTRQGDPAGLGYHRTVQREVESSGHGETGASDLPLLPRGRPLFDGIPARAIVLEELAPAVDCGAMVIRHPDAIGIVLVRDGELFETYCYTGGNQLLGAAALEQISGYRDADVSAYRLDAEIVDVLPALLRGTSCYDDLRLAWTNWKQLLSDLSTRPGTFVVELATPGGRGVICIRDGRQIASYTNEHPEPGNPDLLDQLAAGQAGSIRVRQNPPPLPRAETHPENPPQVGAQPHDPAQARPEEQARAQPQPQPQPHPQPQPQPQPQPEAQTSPTPVAPPPASAEQPLGTVVGGSASNRPLPNTPDVDTAFDESPYESMFDVTPPGSTGTPSPIPSSGGNGKAAPPPKTQPAVAIGDVLPDLKLIARNRLQRSSARVETMLDAAASEDRQLQMVFADIRGLSIRGVMQSTLDGVVEEMQELVERREG